MKTAKQIGSLLLALIMVLSLFPSTAFAEGEIAGDPAVEVDAPGGPDPAVPSEESVIPSEESVILSEDPVILSEDPVILSEAKDLGDSPSAEPAQKDETYSFTEQPKAEAGEDGEITVTWKTDFTALRV